MPLEDRFAPALITVTTTADDMTPNNGSVSLRDAITAINAGNDLGDPDSSGQIPGTFGTNDTIHFNIPGAGVQTIKPGSSGTPELAQFPLPSIVKPVVIDGYSQPGASANTLANADNAVILIAINGAFTQGQHGLELGAGSAGSVIEGLAVDTFQSEDFGVSGDGIYVASDGNTIRGNFVGVAPDGTTKSANGGVGIHVVSGSDNTIGGIDPASRNVVTGNGLDGIEIQGTIAAPATGNVVAGNFVGVAADGKSAVGPPPNSQPGSGSGNAYTGIEINGADHTTVGGTAAGARNVVGLNTEGIWVTDGGQNNTIQGNFVGVAADGVTAAANILHGVVVRSYLNPAPNLNFPQANEPATSFNLVGGTVAGAGNLIVFNGVAGVAVFGNPVAASGQPNVGNAIEGNSIFQNGRYHPATRIGIDLTSFPGTSIDDGVTPNDSRGHGAADDPNNFQNFPVLTSVTTESDGTTAVRGTLNAAANMMFRIEFFTSDRDPLGGVPEGQQFVGFVNVATNASGAASFNTRLGVPVAGGRILTATATDPAGNTSEFSAGVADSRFLLRGTSGADTVVVSRPTGGATGDVTYQLNGGPAVTLHGLTQFTFSGFGGNDTLTVDDVNGPPILSQGIVDAAGNGSNKLFVNASKTSVANVVKVTSTQITTTTGAATLPITYSTAGGSFAHGVVVMTGTGADTVTVQSTLAGAPTRVDTGAGNDKVAVTGKAPLLTVVGGAGTDSATLAGSAGADKFVATPTHATLTGTGFSEAVTGFEQVVASAGAGSDKAYFYGSTGSDKFVGTLAAATLSGTGFFNRATGFDQVFAYAGTGSADVADLYDSAGNDTFTGKGSIGELAGAGYHLQVADFDRVQIHGSTGVNKKKLGVIDYVFKQFGTWV